MNRIALPCQQRGFIGWGPKRAINGSRFWREIYDRSIAADLTSDIVAQRAKGSATLTFTRATIGTLFGSGPAAVPADGVVLLSESSGNARFVGARQVSAGVYSTTWADGTPITSANSAFADAKGPFGLLFEQQRTNLLKQSNAFTTTPWAAVGTPAATQNALGPDGTTSAWTITDNSLVVAEAPEQSFNLSATTYTAWYMAEKTVGAQASYPILGLGTVAGEVAQCTIDTTNGIATAWTAVTGKTVVTSSASISSRGNFWAVALTFAATADTWYLDILAAGTTDPTQSTGIIDVTAQGSSVIYGGQVGQYAFRSSYIPTGATAVTRNADILQGVSAGNLQANNSVISMEIQIPTNRTAASYFYFGTYVDASNYTALLDDGTNLIARDRIGGVNHDATIAFSPVAGTVYGIARRKSSTTGIDVFLRTGTTWAKGTNDPTTTDSQIGTNFQICGDGNDANQPFATGRNFGVNPYALADAQIATL